MLVYLAEILKYVSILMIQVTLNYKSIMVYNPPSVLLYL